MECQRSLFFLPEDVHYLNCAYMAPMSEPVERAGIDGIRMKRVPSRVVPSDFFDGVDRVRTLFAGLVHAQAEQIAMVPSVSYGIALAARNLVIERGDNIVTLHEQFPSNVYTWRRLAEERGAILRTVEAPEGPDRGKHWNEHVLEAIDQQTGVVALPHVHWADGTRFDLEAIGKRCRSVGAALIVDGTQSVGAMPFDIQRIQPDLLVCAGYKWLLGPYSAGVAYVGPRVAQGIPLEESWIARKGSRDFAGLVRYQDEYDVGAARFDVGERSNFILVPMLEAALKLVTVWTPAAVQSYTDRLMGPSADRLASLGYGVEERSWRGAHLFGIRKPEHVDAATIKRALARHGVSVSFRGDAVRVSPHVYNDARDVQALEDALTSVIQEKTSQTA